MNALIVFSALVAAANAGLIAAPYAAGIPYAAAGAYPYAYGAAPLAYAQAPVIAKAAPVAAAPVAVAPAPVAVTTPVSSQYQAQDEFGNVNYGYSNINSAKQEVGNAYTGVAGSYKYVDANGVPQRVDYVADDLGFRITGATNLPVAPVAAALPNVPFGGFTTAYSNINPGPVAGPLTPAYGDAVATPRGLRPLALEGFSEDLDQDGFVDPIAPAVPAPIPAPIVRTVPIPAAAPVFAQAPVAAPVFAQAPIAAPVAAAPIVRNVVQPTPFFNPAPVASPFFNPAAVAGPVF